MIEFKDEPIMNVSKLLKEANQSIREQLKHSLKIIYLSLNDNQFKKIEIIR